MGGGWQVLGNTVANAFFSGAEAHQERGNFWKAFGNSLAYSAISQGVSFGTNLGVNAVFGHKTLNASSLSTFSGRLGANFLGSATASLLTGFSVDFGSLVSSTPQSTLTSELEKGVIKERNTQANVSFVSADDVIMLPEIPIEAFRSGNLPYWWGRSNLFMNGGIGFRIHQAQTNFVKTSVEIAADGLGTVGSGTTAIGMVVAPFNPIVGGAISVGGGTLSTLGTGLNVGLDIADGNYGKATFRTSLLIGSGGINKLLFYSRNISGNQNLMLQSVNNFYWNGLELAVDYYSN